MVFQRKKYQTNRKKTQFQTDIDADHNYIHTIQQPAKNKKQICKTTLAALFKTKTRGSARGNSLSEVR